MNIELLKAQIENRNIPNDLIVFKYGDNDFIPRQYIKHIAKIKNLDIQYIENLENIVTDVTDIFGTTKIQENILKVLFTKELNYIDTCKTKTILDEPNIIIVISKFATKPVEKLFENNTVYVPKLEEWQIKDYVYSMADGIDPSKLNPLIDLCKGDIYRLHKELDKISIFTPNERNYIYDDFVSDGIFSDLTTYGIFNFTNAIAKRDYASLKAVMKEINSIDITPMGLLILLYQTFRNIVCIQLNPAPTPDNTGLSQKQLYALKYSCGYYTKQQLLSIFEFLTSIDGKIKLGEMPMEILTEYILIKILTY